MYPIDATRYRAKGFNRRVRFLIMHYTAINFSASINALTGPLVSAHYLVPDPSDQTYSEAGFTDLRIFNLVDENERAWHAGVSQWSGRSNLNDTAIGIEIVNLATDNNGHFEFPPFNATQVEAIKELAADILQRYPDIQPTHVLGHSDVSIGRKSDPGAAFPWKELYIAGVGAWYEESTKQKYHSRFCRDLPVKADVVAKLRKYGYETSAVASDSAYKQLIRAFQLHFRPQNYDGVLDAETAAIIYALVEKYFP